MLLVVAAVVLACVTITSTACKGTRSGTARSRLVVASTTLPTSAAVYVADAKGMFQSQGLDVSIRTYGAGRLALAAMLNGDADVALVAQTPIAKSVLDGESPLVFATICRSDNVNMVIGRKDRGIASARDLGGKKVGLLKGTSADFFLNISLVTSGVDPNDVEVVSLETSTLVPAIVSGRVDAISAFAPYIQQSVDRLGANAIVLDEPGLLATYWNATTTRPFATGQGESLQAFIRALDEANDFIVSHPRESQRITGAATNVQTSDVRRQWSDLHWSVSLDQSLILSLEDEYRWMAGEEKTPDFLRYLEPNPLRAIDPSRVTIVDPGN